MDKNLGYFILSYKPFKNDNKDNNKLNKIRIFGRKFVENNKNRCRIIYKHREYELQEYFQDIEKNKYNEDLIQIKLVVIETLVDLSEMFYNCDRLISFIDNSEDNTDTNLSNFDKLKLYRSNTEYNIKDNIDINLLFEKNYFLYYTATSLYNKNKLINSLKSSPDMANRNILNVNNITSIFYGCKSLITLPDISKWDTSKVIDMSSIFNGCKSLITLPDISKWDTSKVTDMSSIFRYI